MYPWYPRPIKKKTQNSESAAPFLADFFAVITQLCCQRSSFINSNHWDFDFIGNTHTESYYGYFQVSKHYVYVIFHSNIPVKLTDLLFLRCYNICWRTGWKSFRTSSLSNKMHLQCKSLKNTCTHTLVEKHVCIKLHWLWSEISPTAAHQLISPVGKELPNSSKLLWKTKPWNNFECTDQVSVNNRKPA